MLRRFVEGPFDRCEMPDAVGIEMLKPLLFLGDGGCWAEDEWGGYRVMHLRYDRWSPSRYDREAQEVTYAYTGRKGECSNCGWKA